MAAWNRGRERQSVLERPILRIDRHGNGQKAGGQLHAVLHGSRAGARRRQLLTNLGQPECSGQLGGEWSATPGNACLVWQADREWTAHALEAALRMADLAEVCQWRCQRRFELYVRSSVIQQGRK